MLITNQSNNYCINIMEKLRATLTPIRRNVARKSTANRPLLNVILKDPLAEDDENDYINNEKTLSTPIDFTKYSADESSKLGFYYEDGVKNTPKRLSLRGNNKLNDVEDTLESTENSINTTLQEESEEEHDDLDGIFSVSEALVKYLNEGLQSPPNYDSSDESIDFSKVQNFPVKNENYSKSEDYLQSNFSEKVISPPLECKLVLGPGKNIKHEIFCDDTKVLPVIATQNLLIENDGSTTELGTQTVRCLFDPNLESVTCKVKVREEVLVCENVPLKMTILEANFDLDHLENRVEENGYDVKSDDEKDVSFMPQVICAMSLGNTANNKSNEAGSQAVEKQKKEPKKTKKVSFNSTENVSVGEKRMTRNRIQATNSSTKRITRNSSKLSLECLSNNDATSAHNSCDDSVDNNYAETTIDNTPNENEQPNTDLETVDYDDSDINKANEEKGDIKKKCILDKKGKKDINEGVLLHVEATKETELMRDGKIIKDKEEFLKDIESKIDKNLPVVVEKEFDIQQSLTEEILLDQALRLAHQRTSPRLSKIMKEAIVKASLPKPSTKSKLPKGNNNKSEIKQKGNKSTVQRNSSEESDTADSTLNNSSTSESASEMSSNLESFQKDVDKVSDANEIISKRKKENYIVAPMIKQSNDEKVVEPLTIKIFRKNNKKKAGFKLSLKKKKSPKKKGSFKSKLVHSSDVNMDDLSKTFEDILQDDNWCSNDKDIDLDSISLVGSEEKMFTPLDSNMPDSNNINSDNSNNDRKDISLDLKIVNNEPSLLKKSEEIAIESCHSDKPVKKKAKKPKLISSDSKIVSSKKDIKASNPSNSSNEITYEKNIDEQSILNKESSIALLGETEPSLMNRHDSPDKELSVVSSKTNEMSSEKIPEAKENNDRDNDTTVRPCRPTSATVNIDSVISDEATITTKFNKISTSPMQDTSQYLSNAQSKNVNSSSTQQFTTSSTTLSSHVPHQTSINELAPKNNHILINENENKQFFSVNGVEMHKQNVPQRPINNSNSNLNVQINEKCIIPYPEHASNKFPVNTPNIDSQPKVLPLSIASRDPRLRKSHVRVIVEVNTSSVSNSMIEKPNIHEETRILSHVTENVSKEINISKDVDSDAEVNENQLEVERKKKLKKREVDSELLYKTPLSDLHDVPERSSYARSIRKKSPPKIDMRDQRKWSGSAISQSAERSSEAYHEYHEINMVYSKMSHYDPIRTEMVNPDQYKRNIFDNTKIENCRSDSQSSDHYSLCRSDEVSSNLRRRENHTKLSSSEYTHEAVRHTNELSERSIGYQNHSDHRRSSYQPKAFDQDYRRSENYPPDYVPSKNYSRGYKRLNDFSVDHGHRESPDYKEKERVRERNSISHNEPSYSRWDYAHVKGRLPAEVPLHSAPKEEGPPPNDRNLWEEERDLIDGPVKNLVRPYYRRKKFSREELFDRRTDNRRYTADNDRNFERLWVHKTDQELIHGPERWERRSRKVFRDSREDRSRSPRRDHDRYGVRRSRSPGGYFKSKTQSSPSPCSPCGSPVVLDSPMSPEPAERFCILEPTKCLTVPQ